MCARVTAAPETAPATRAIVLAPRTPAPHSGRDVSLDLVRGLAMVILVMNHLRLEPWLSDATGAVLSAAEVLVAVSGVVVGMVFGGRWLTRGARPTTGMLLRRSLKLYVASVVVVALVGVATYVPGLATEALTVSPNMSPAIDLYAFEGEARTALAILTLEAGPWQFSILGFFIASLAVAPALLWALARGWWPVVLGASWLLFALGREWQVDVLPSQSERPFPILVWQVLFVNGMLVGWYRTRLTGRRRTRRAPIWAVAALAAGFACLQIAGPLLDSAAFARWKQSHFDKGSLDLLRVLAMTSIAGSLYALLRRHAELAERTIGALLLPLGRNSFYVFIMHVFVCMAVASVPILADEGGLGPAGNTVVQLGCVALLAEMVRRRFLFRWVPR